MNGFKDSRYNVNTYECIYVLIGCEHLGNVQIRFKLMQIHSGNVITDGLDDAD